jgi:hypothetical protein
MGRAALLLLFAACGNSSSVTSSADASIADAAEAGSADASNPFNVGDTSQPDTSQSPCDELKQQVIQLGLTARKCNPQAPSECGATTDGPCCPITVDIGSTSAVNDYDHAVGQLWAAMDAGTCTYDCKLAYPCKQAPSNVCGTNSECQ